jgi:hypothetical protein
MKPATTTTSASGPDRLIRNALLLAVFALAMGYMEAAIVVYLRQLYYPQGFSFPLANTMIEPVFVIELGRELATIVILTVAAWLAGRNKLERLAWFLFVFGTWDIFYYLGLKVLLDWPPSLLTWDILFLIPFPWAAPVLAPLIVAASMAALGLGLIGLGRKRRVRLGVNLWLALTAGAAVLLSFLGSYLTVLFRHPVLCGPFDVHSGFRTAIAAHVPTCYPWWLLALAELLVWTAFIRVCRARPEPKPTQD